ncbi:hypothetical protein B566_EDAN001508 [Ephemera danica]|nr:hypothetical protein B566_EDAN001508 [Ephemera danica]
MEIFNYSTALCLGTYASYPHCWRKHNHSLACDIGKTKKKPTCKLLQLILGIAVAQPLTDKTAEPNLEDDSENKEQEAESEVGSQAEQDGLEFDDPIEEAKKNLQRVAGHVDNIFGVLCIKSGWNYDAFRSFEYAWQMGDVNACFNLGLCYEQGVGTTEDQAMAVKYYQKASNLGHAGAKYNLAIYYSQGRGGLPVDNEKASDLFRSAARGGLEEAVKVLELDELPEPCETDAQQAGPSSSGNWSPQEAKQEDVAELCAPQLHLAEATSSGDWNPRSLQRHSV